jgi:hypothetical protein
MDKSSQAGIEGAHGFRDRLLHIANLVGNPHALAQLSGAAVPAPPADRAG